MSRGARLASITLAAGLATVLVLAGVGGADAQEQSPTRKPAAAPPKTKKTAPVPDPIEGLPYSIRIYTSINPTTRIDRYRRARRY